MKKSLFHLTLLMWIVSIEQLRKSRLHLVLLMSIFLILKKLKVINAFSGVVTLCSDFDNSPLIHHQDGKGDKSCFTAVLS